MSGAEKLIREERWRLILGGGQADGTGIALSGELLDLDQCLEMVYTADAEGGPRAGTGASSPKVARWLGDIRKFFPTSVVRVMQQDAIKRLGLDRLLLEPEILATVEPDVHLIATLITLKNVIPAKTKATARLVVNRVVEEMLRRLEQPMRQAVAGALNRAARNRRPKLREIDWHRTIRANMKNYLPEQKTVIPEIRIGFGRKRAALRDIVLCVDQSGSMATSVVYSSIFAAVMASLPALATRLVVFDTAVVDLSDELQGDPVDVLFGVQLGGGTDINRALAYCQGLISDLAEGGNAEEMLKRAANLVASGVNCIALLALSDDGAAYYDHHNAARFAALGIPAFACTPDLFPELMATAIARRDIHEWAATNEIVTKAG
jgi:hypothetical protein